MTDKVKTKQKSIWLLVAILSLQIFLFGEALAQPAVTCVPQTELIAYANDSETPSSVQLHNYPVSLNATQPVANRTVRFTNAVLVLQDRLINIQLDAVLQEVLTFDLPIFFLFNKIPSSSKKEAAADLFLS